MVKCTSLASAKHCGYVSACDFEKTRYIGTAEPDCFFLRATQKWMMGVREMEQKKIIHEEDDNWN